MDFGRFCVDVSSSLFKSAQLWQVMLMMEEAMHVWGGHVWEFHCKPKTLLNNNTFNENIFLKKTRDVTNQLHLAYG